MRLRRRHSLMTRLTFSRATPAIAAISARLIFSWSTICPALEGVPTYWARSTNARATRPLTVRKVVEFELAQRGLETPHSLPQLRV
jgi:hypothetical protein